ncbi:hypothetical protein lerEdw1_004844 [Lerista edwardsae]|nr:hypothetical protein lerEdw1_004844 [Lerista edwardsae]
MSLCNNGANMPSPQEPSNGFPQPGASGTWHKPEEEVRLVEAGLVKKAHREILDHERKRRVELKCMELQEMMEEQGYSEEEIRQKVGTFRQMLMEKEGVLTREDQHGRQIVIENHHMVDGEEYAVDYPEYGEGCPLRCDCATDCYQDDSSHQDYRLKRRSSTSTSPPPKKKKKKKSGHRRSRKKRKPGSERSGDSSSPVRKEKKKKTGKKHRRDRSASGSRKKRRHSFLLSLRSRSPKSRRKEKNKDRKRSHSESSSRRSHRHSSCSSRSASLSSDYSDCKSTGRLSPKYREDGQKASSHRSSRSPSSSCTRHSRSATPHQNGHKGSTHNGRHSHSAQSEKQQELWPVLFYERFFFNFNLCFSLASRSKCEAGFSITPDQGPHQDRSPFAPLQRRQGEQARPQGPPGGPRRWAGAQEETSMSAGATPGPHPCTSTKGVAGRRPLPPKTLHARSARQATAVTPKDPPARIHTTRPLGLRRTMGCTSKPHCTLQGQGEASPQKTTQLLPSPGQTLQAPPGAEEEPLAQQLLELQPVPIQIPVPIQREEISAQQDSVRVAEEEHKQQLLFGASSSREKDNEPRTRHSDTEPSRARRRSRSYSPIRKRRRDSPSFMEPRRITRFLREKRQAEPIAAGPGYHDYHAQSVCQSRERDLCSLASCRPQAPDPLLPAQPILLQLAEQLLVQPQPESQLRQLQQQPQPDAQPEPQPKLQQPEQLRECRVLSAERMSLEHLGVAVPPARSPCPPTPRMPNLISPPAPVSVPLQSHPELPPRVSGDAGFVPPVKT